MQKIILAISISVFSFSLHAEQIYKCTKDDGNISFQSAPCALKQGKAEKLEIDNEADPNYRPPTFSSHDSSYKNSSSDISKILRKSEKRREKRLDDYEKKKCDRYKGYLSDAQDNWDNVARQGYKQWQKETYLARIKTAKRDMERECR